MTGPPSLSEAVIAALGAELESRGLRSEGQAAVHVRPLADDVDSWVGLNHGTRPTGAVVLNPVIGVRHGSIEAEVARLAGDADGGEAPPTVAAPLAHWDPKLSSPTFDGRRGWRADRRLRAVAAAIERACAELAEQAASVEGLAEVLRDPRFGLAEEGTIRRVVALDRLGHHDEADKVAERLLAGLGGRTDPAARRVTLFVERFRSRRRPGS